MRTNVEGTPERGFVDISHPDPALLAALAEDMAPLRPSVPEAFHAVAAGYRLADVPNSIGSPGQLLLELAGIKTAIRTWYEKEPDQVIREASAYSARLTEVWTELKLLEAVDRAYTQLRTMQVTPVLEEIDRQYKMATSRVAMRRQDVDLLTRG